MDGKSILNFEATLDSEIQQFTEGRDVVSYR